ncbi:hypothetical protein [Lawsonibacter sp. JLR.KK007]|jgi:hypothetical protein|uniref:hypothetical protein n=2 Tax=Bacillota TaxID=1239 RepID=UPI002FF3C420
MYEIKRDELTRKNVFAGDFPIAKEVGEVAEGETVRQYAPVIKTAGGFKEATAAGLDELYGIAADDSTDGGVVCMLTGEFFADGLTLPEGVTAEALKPAFRKLGIFLK